MIIFLFPQDSKIRNAFNVGVIMSGTCFMNANIGTLLAVECFILTMCCYKYSPVRKQGDMDKDQF